MNLALLDAPRRVSAPQVWMAPGSAELAAREQQARRILRVLKVLITVVVFGQRFALVNGQQEVPIALIASYVALFALLRLRAVTPVWQRVQLFVLGGTLCCIAAGIAKAFPITDSAFSMPSLLFLLVIWAPWVLVVRERYAALIYRPLLDYFVTLMKIVAVLAIVQFVLQFVGVSYSDYFGHLMPKSLVQTGFNTDYPITYGSSVYKANAYLMLEPSFLSQFLALGFIAGVLRGVRGRVLVLLVIGIVVSFSGTGLMLLLVGLALIVVRQPWRITRRAIVVGSLLVGAFLASPANHLLLSRVQEFQTAGSSGSSRFVEPYAIIDNYIGQSPLRLVAGGGPGSARIELSPTQLSLIYPIVPKLAGEYGLIAGAAFAAFIVVCVSRRSRTPILPGVTLVLLFAASAALQEPHITVTAWVLVALFARLDPDGVAPPGPPSRISRLPRATPRRPANG